MGLDVEEPLRRAGDVDGVVARGTFVTGCCGCACSDL